MILPSKNIALDKSPIMAGATILKMLSKKNTTIDDLFERLKSDYGDYYWIIGLRAINMLYLSGKIYYDLNNDYMVLINEDT